MKLELQPEGPASRVKNQINNMKRNHIVPNRKIDDSDLLQDDRLAF